MSVARCQKEVNAREFAEWTAFETIDPGEPERSDAQAASICLVLYNLLKSKDAREMELADFVLKFRDEPVDKAAHAQSVMTKLMSWKTLHNGVEAAKKRRKLRADA